MLYSYGLIKSQMIKPHTVMKLFSMQILESPVIFFLAGALVVTFIGFSFARKSGKPVMAQAFEIESPDQNQGVDGYSVVGPILFGIGWGITGLIPSTAVCLITTTLPELFLVFFPMLILGSILVSIYEYLNLKSFTSFEVHILPDFAKDR